MAETPLEFRADARVAAQEIASPQQQIEEVERAGAPLRRLVGGDDGAELGLEARGQVGVARGEQLVECGLHSVSGSEGVFAREVIAIRALPTGPAPVALAPTREIS